LFLRPTTPSTDPWRREFDCGSDDINEIIRNATWYEGPQTAVRAIQFGTVDHVVGYIVMGLNRLEYPGRLSKPKRLYLYLDAIGVSLGFREMAPGARRGARYSDVMLRHVIEVMAPAYPTIVGLYAIVREENVPAIDLLTRAQFDVDSDPSFRDAVTGMESLLYRLPLSADARSGAGSRRDRPSETGNA
jgi:hypothetical protein